MTDDGLSVFRSKRDATRYQILVEIAERQPAVSQKEIASSIGVTAQAVSDYLRALVEEGYVEKHGRGRYEVTKEGVDWLISRTEEVRDFVRHVSEDVVEQVDVETALATAEIEEGQPVSLSMRDGVLRATPGETGDATAVAVTDAPKGGDVGVTDFEGILDYEPGKVTIVSVPRIQNGGSRSVDADTIDQLAEGKTVAVAGVEALASVRASGAEPEIRFGTVEAVHEAATKGIDVLLVCVTDRMSSHTDKLRQQNISYEVIDAN
ncbi:MAG: winged helix-turn-helix transcriptional regulator [Halobacteria archaeon]|nr:winged helix-turn-helix transcriptional regulator [Halobacteria archaeon]